MSMPTPPGSSASPARVEPPFERLGLTYTKRIWHITKPGKEFYSLCSEWLLIESTSTPRFSDVCLRCLKSYQRELRGGV